MIEKILSDLCTKLNCWAGVVMQPNTEMTEMICIATWNLPNDWVKATNVLDGKSMNSKCYLENKVVVDNQQNFPKPDTAKTIHNVYAAAVVPIWKNGQVLGTLELLSDDKNGAFNDTEIEVMERTSEHLSKLI